MKMATSLAREKEINVNNNLKRQEICSNQAVVIKKIPMNTLKDMIITAVSEFGKIKLIKIQLIGMWQKAVIEFVELDQANLLVSKWSFLIGKDSVHIAKAVENCETWASKNQFRVLLFTLLVKIIAHNLGTFLKRAGGKTCIINRFLETGNRICYAIVGFKSDNNLESAFCTELILGSIKLSWTRMDLVWCEKYEKFGHSVLECNTPVASFFKSSRTFKKVVFNEHRLRLAKLYEKRNVPIFHPAAFGKFWAQMVLFAGSSNGLCFASSFGSPFSDTSGLNNDISPLLTDQISGIVCKLNNMKLDLVLDIVMNDSELVLSPTSSTFLSVSTLDLSSSKVLTTKIGSLESKLVALEASVNSVLVKLDHLCAGLATCNVQGINVPAKQEDVIYWHKNMDNLISIFTETKLKDKVHPWIADKFEGIRVFTSGLDSEYLGAGIVIIMDSFLVKHVCKIFEVPSQLFSIRLLFKNKLSVSVLELYAGALSAAWFLQAGEINSFIAKAANRSFFVIFGGNFNEDSLKKSVSFKKCVSLGLVNSLVVVWS
ncbi:hypothetical protein G9A89_016717 [Geosiphon pyriformis]|nr:hypothetical protein G9A89_016717 [Geosiphon pyriformis]